MKDFPQIDFNDDYKKYSEKQMNFIKSNLDKLWSEYKIFKTELSDYFINFENCFPALLKEVSDCVDWLHYTKNLNDKKVENINKNKNFINNICDKFKKCNNFINTIT